MSFGNLGGSAPVGEMIEVSFINNLGGGLASRVQVRVGTPIERFFADRMGSRTMDNFLIRVNRSPVEAGYALRHNDTVSITPTKVSGAIR